MIGVDYVVHSTLGDVVIDGIDRWVVASYVLVVIFSKVDVLQRDALLDVEVLLVFIPGELVSIG